MLCKGVGVVSVSVMYADAVIAVGRCYRRRGVVLVEGGRGGACARAAINMRAALAHYLALFRSNRSNEYTNLFNVHINIIGFLYVFIIGKRV